MPETRGTPTLPEKSEEDAAEAEAGTVTMAESKEGEPIKCIGGNILSMMLILIFYR